jgi:hypothetical protein
MRSPGTILADLDKLRAARGKAARVIQFADRRIEYRSDAEMATAIAALETELEAAQGVTSPRTVVVRPLRNKGW